MIELEKARHRLAELGLNQAAQCDRQHKSDPLAV